LRVCDLVLGPVDDQVHLVTHLEEATGQLQVMHDEHEALHNSASRVRDLVLERSGEVPSMAVAPSLTADLVEGRVDAMVANGSIRGPSWR
jgi:hypothetical protein